MKHAILILLSLAVVCVGTGCSSSEQAPGYDAASRDAAEALAKNGNDITKITPEQRAALQKAAQGYPGGGGVQAGGPGGAPASSGTAAAPQNRQDSGSPPPGYMNSGK
jgi:hypothetical protein